MNLILLMEADGKTDIMMKNFVASNFFLILEKGLYLVWFNFWPQF